VLASISRVMTDVVSDEQKELAGRIKKAMAIYREAEDLINIGAYVRGSNEKIDYSISVIDNIISLIEQKINEKFTYSEIIEIMRKVLY
jgi:flagellum-specific ATP synthase